MDWLALTPEPSCSVRFLDDPHQDFPQTCLLAAPLAEGDRLYCTTNRGEVICLEVGHLRKGKGEPRLLWKLDLRKSLDVNPVGTLCPGVGLACSIGPSYKGRLYVITGNGVGPDLKDVPAPKAPSLVCLDRDTGKVLWSDNSPGKGILHSQWSSPLIAEVKGRAQVIAAQGDGWVRSFDALTGELLWKFDTNPAAAVWKTSGRGTRNYLSATPVFHDGLVYIANGRGPDDGDGVGHLWCIDSARIPRNEAKDLSPARDDFDPAAAANKDSGLVWHYGGMTPPAGQKCEEWREWVFGRTISTVSIHDGLVIAPDLAGCVHCLDARTGRRYWTHDARANICASPLIVDGKVYMPTTDGVVVVLALAREEKVLARNEVEGYLYSPAVFADGILYFATGTKLYAIKEEVPRR